MVPPALQVQAMAGRHWVDQQHRQVSRIPLFDQVGIILGLGGFPNVPRCEAESFVYFHLDLAQVMLELIRDEQRLTSQALI